LEHWEKIYAVFVAASHLYEATQEAEDIAVDFDLLQEEIAAELELLRFHEDRIQKLEAKIPVYYQKIDPHKILTSITGIGPTIGAAVTARVGNIADFPNLKGFRSYCGYVPRKKQTSKTDRKGMPITKAANNLLKSYLYMAAETARHWDPQFADFYDRLVFVQKKHHNAAMAALANKMVGRIYGVLRRAADPKPQQPAAYQLRDLQGQPISKAQARELALEIASRRKHKEERSSGTA
jgi:transposase